MRKIKKNSGMTLIEMVLAIAIFSILSTGISMIMVPTLGIYAETLERSELNSMVNNFSNIISNELSKATEPPVISEGNQQIAITAGERKTVFTVEEGLLCQNYSTGGAGAFPVLDESYYKKKKIEVHYGETEPKKIYSLEIILFRKDGTELIRRTTVVAPVVLNQ